MHGAAYRERGLAWVSGRWMAYHYQWAGRGQDDPFKITTPFSLFHFYYDPLSRELTQLNVVGFPTVSLAVPSDEDTTAPAMSEPAEVETATAEAMSDTAAATLPLYPTIHFGRAARVAAAGRFGPAALTLAASYELGTLIYPLIDTYAVDLCVSLAERAKSEAELECLAAAEAAYWEQVEWIRRNFKGNSKARKNTRRVLWEQAMTAWNNMKEECEGK